MEMHGNQILQHPSKKITFRPTHCEKKRVLARTPGQKPAVPTGKMLPTEGNKHFLTDQKSGKTSIETLRSQIMLHP